MSSGGSSGSSGQGDAGSSGGNADGGEADAGDTGCITSCRPGLCGAVSDRCGGIITCPGCATGEVCGLVQPNVCGVPPSACTPLTPEVACAGKCGSVSNGCDGVIACDGVAGADPCTSNQVCGGYGTMLMPNTCVDKPMCMARSCQDANAQCGQVGDGCGGVLDCTALLGACPGTQVCGTGADANRCVDPVVVTCTRRTAVEACVGTCGIVSDGCDGQIDCETTVMACTGGTTCGGSGIPGVCGVPVATCVPDDVTQVCAGKCGTVGDGCGGSYTCSNANGGWTCDAAAGESCGGGGMPGVCGRPACQPISMATACPGSGGRASCGPVADGCGGLIQCGNCSGTDICGLNQPGICDAVPVCQRVPVATACAGKCGDVPDGCGGSYTCTAANGGVTCNNPQYCGASLANTCGSPPSQCMARTCASLGHTCGLAGDGCGGTLNCWPSGQTACPDPQTQTCKAGTNGAQTCVTGVAQCVGPFCGQLPNCTADPLATKLTGTVVTPGRTEGGNIINRIPVPNAVVYIPGDPTVALPSIFQGVVEGDPASCGRCQDDRLVAAGQSILAGGVTDYTGRFTLEGRIPVGVAFNLVIKAGKWRRVVQVPANVVSECQSRPLDIELTRLNRDPGDGLAGTHLPRIAIATGSADGMECLFRNIGIAEAQFTIPTGTGRIHMYRGEGTRGSGTPRGGAQMCGGTYTQGGNTRQCTANNNEGCVNAENGCGNVAPGVSTLYGNQATLNGYDMVVWDCEGNDNTTGGNGGIIENYVNSGGRMFASHFAFTWIENNGTLDASADWGTSGSVDNDIGYISLPTGNTARTRANPVKSVLFRNYLDWQGALVGSTANQLSNPATPRFYITDPRDRAGAAVGPSTDEWIYRTTATNGDPDENEPNANDKRVQQLSFNTPYGAADTAICGRVAYSGFHVTPISSPQTKYFPNLCSNGALSTQEKVLVFMLFDLSSCVSTGDPPTAPRCTPALPAAVCPTDGTPCGSVSDGCGGVVDCGTCSMGTYCDGNRCRSDTCSPQTCATLGYNCGSAPDGCGGVARNAQGQPGCGQCSENQECGLGGPGRCGAPACTPIPLATACPAGRCGRVSDGCGGLHDCGGCGSGLVCGGGGPNTCGPSSCAPSTQGTACAGLNCGQVSDGCSGSHNCGMCTAPEVCGAGGQANICGVSSCVPRTQAVACAGLDCGWVSDGCTGAINCGTCPNGGTCGGAGPNLCGGGCTPATCQSAGAECGIISDLCGGIVQCPPCPSGETCGADGPNLCGTGPTCTPTTCSALGAGCGLVGDGCGGVLNCGTCTGSLTCGGAGQANQCGMGPGGCTPRTCSSQSVQCGAASDGCGGLLDCGTCEAGSTCELGACVLIGG